jgi:hypothetical protein
MKTYNDRIKEGEDKSKGYRNIREFYFANPYLYRWCLKHGVELRKYFPARRIECKVQERENKGIDCYTNEGSRFYKHFPFIADAMRELDLTYYYIRKVLDGEMSSVNGYAFVRCE